MVTLLHLLLSGHVVYLRKFVARAFGKSRWQFDPLGARCLLPAHCSLPAHCLFICTYPSIPRSINERRRRWDASIPPKGCPIIDPTHVCRGAATCAHAGLGALSIYLLASPAWIVGRMLESSDVYSDRHTVCTYARIAVRLQLMTTALQLLSRCFVMRRG